MWSRAVDAGIVVRRSAGSICTIELAALVPALWAVASGDDGFRLWADCGLGWTLLALSWIDWRHMILPDVLTLPLVLAGLGCGFHARSDNIVDHAAGAAIGYLLFIGVAWAYRLARGRDGLGEGDAKLLAAAGAWVTWLGLAEVMLIAAVTGLLAALGKFPQGPAGRRADRDPLRPLPGLRDLAGLALRAAAAGAAVTGRHMRREMTMTTAPTACRRQATSKPKPSEGS